MKPGRYRQQVLANYGFRFGFGGVWLLISFFQFLQALTIGAPNLIAISLFFFLLFLGTLIYFGIQKQAIEKGDYYIIMEEEYIIIERVHRKEVRIEIHNIIEVDERGKKGSLIPRHLVITYQKENDDFPKSFTLQDVYDVDIHELYERINKVIPAN